MDKITACRYTIRELNTQYFHDKPFRLSLSISLLGEADGNVTIVIDRIGSEPIIKPLVELPCGRTGKKSYFIRQLLKYGDYYMVKADESYDIQFWTETEEER